MIVFVLTSWLILGLTIGNVKGKQNAIQKFLYRAVRIIPIQAAVRLNVAYHHQEHPLSCEVASLLMALRYKGVEVTETTLIDQLPISDAGPRGKNNIWGDPDLGFVGNIDGSMPNTGYGVYEQPIYDVATKYRPAKIISNSSIDDLLNELANDNPVVVWGVSIGRSRDISWKTPEGKTITALLDEHARTLIGFTGTRDKPVLMILLDPIYGEIRLPVNDFLKNWGLLKKRAVVIY